MPLRLVLSNLEVALFHYGFLELEVGLLHPHAVVNRAYGGNLRLFCKVAERRVDVGVAVNLFGIFVGFRLFLLRYCLEDRNLHFFIVPYSHAVVVRRHGVDALV